MADNGWIYDEIEGGSRQDFGRASSHVRWIRQPAIHLLHTTEGSGWPGYSNGGSAPHLTINPRLRQTRQHFSLLAGARALRPGGVEANNYGTVQYEIIGYAKDTQDWSDADLAYIAHVLSVVGRHTGIKAQSSVEFKGSADAYGTNSSTRMSASRFRTYEGIAGHQHVPGNTHWDPGMFPIGRLLALMGGSAPIDNGDDIMSRLPTLVWKTPTTKKMGLAHGRLQGLLKATGDYTGEIDEIPGRLSIAALERLQVRLNCGDGRGRADRVAGDKTWESALLGTKWPRS